MTAHRSRTISRVRSNEFELPLVLEPRKRQEIIFDFAVASRERGGFNHRDTARRLGVSLFAVLNAIGEIPDDQYEQHINAV